MVEEWHQPPVKFVMVGVTLISSLMFFLIALSVKDTLMKILALLIAFAGFLLTVYSQITWIMQS